MNLNDCTECDNITRILNETICECKAGYVELRPTTEASCKFLICNDTC